MRVLSRFCLCSCLRWILGNQVWAINPLDHLGGPGSWHGLVMSMGNWSPTMTHLSLPGPLSILARKGRMTGLAQTAVMESCCLSLPLPGSTSLLGAESGLFGKSTADRQLVGAPYSLLGRGARALLHPQIRGLCCEGGCSGRKWRTELERALGCLGPTFLFGGGSVGGGHL